ncbi:MAG TPA: hypothetical protein VFH85_01785 [Gammaproteobacteria bacterium]|nr:hypothetical protein [Gammaproteobacteria bacterium]
MKPVLSALKDRLPLQKETGDVAVHLQAAAEWICRAQQATGTGGVAACYDLEKKAWAGAYPETTGYIIPTFYDYAVFAGRADFAERARQMAVWEADIQLEDGAVRAGTMDSEQVAPTVFNTGQVLFGWTRAWKETGDLRFRSAAIHAAEWLSAAQDADGAWRRFASPFARYKVNSYNTRTAYGVARVGAAFDQPRFLDAARANIEWAISRAHANAWLDDNCLEINGRPLTHTIAYSLRGILEVGIILQEDRYLDFAARMARAVASAQRSDGALPGRLDERWRPKVRWSCLTGNAQMAINWLRLADIAGDASFRSHAQRANRFNMMTQALAGPDETRGAIKGSFPADGGYMTWRYPNWAAKFFMDALMLEQGFAID